jgi:hypothetical protein
VSISQPSHEVYYINVPEVKLLVATFQYNFFTPDECVNETGGVPANFLSRPGSEIDSDFIQYSLTRAPRLVSFSWTNPKLADVGSQVTELAQRNNSFRTTGAQNGSLILDNIDKVISEDNFATNNFASVNFHDGAIDAKIHELVSGTIVTETLENGQDPNTSPYKAAQRLIPTLPTSIAPHFVFQAMTAPAPGLNSGLTFYVPPATSAGASTGGGLGRASTSSRVTSNYFDRLKAVRTNTQINTKFIHDLINRTIVEAGSPQAVDLVNMHQFSKQAQQATNQRFSPAISEQDYKTYLPYVSAKQGTAAGHVDKYAAEIVGYIIDKFAVNADGSTTAEDPIIIDSATANISADYQVKFNANYCYAIRTVAQLTIPAIDDDDGSVATIKVLVSSKPSNKVYVSTLKLDAPPPPGDVNFYWNYETSKLMVTWAFPVTSERDIAQFQVFRRETTNDCYELQKQYNFDTSAVPWPTSQNPDPVLVERLSSPAAYWIDDDFSMDRNSSQQRGYIYSIVALDAHGLTSNYSAQFQVWFDRFKNKLQKVLVSHAGAPIPYPNMYFEGDLFVDTIQVSGPNATQIKLYFNPEYYYLYDDRNRYVKVLETAQSGGSYKLQFINVDNAKTQDVDITINDLTKITTKKLSYPTVRFGPKRVPQRSQT